MQAIFSWTTVIPVTVFIAIASGVWWLIGLTSADNQRTSDRLDELKDPFSRRRERDEKGARAGDAVTKMLEKASPALSRPLQPKSESEVGKLKLRLSYAGFRSEAAPGIFLGTKFVALVIGLFFSGATMLLVTGFTRDAIIRVVLSTGGMFYFPDAIVWFLARRRKDAIFRSLPDTLDLMVVCVEAGLGLDQAMRKVADEMKKSYRVICDEMSRCNMQLQMGKARAEVLHDLGARTGVDDLRSLASILIQAEKFGSSVGQALRVQSESMRVRRRQLAEEKAAKTAVQLIFPLVLFIFPGIFVVLVGPAAITMVREMFPRMAGNG